MSVIFAHDVNLIVVGTEDMYDYGYINYLVAMAHSGGYAVTYSYADNTNQKFVSIY